MTIRNSKQSTKVNIMIEYPNGNKFWFKNGIIHRDNDLPAVEFAIGTKEWYKNGKIHRDNDLPAVEFLNGDKYWFQNGNFHRDNDLPAIVCENGYKDWFKNGRRYFPYLPILHKFLSKKKFVLNALKCTKILKLIKIPENERKIAILIFGIMISLHFIIFILRY